MKFKVSSETHHNYLVTEPNYIKNYYMKVVVEFDSNTAVLSGYYGNRGIGSYYNSMGHTGIGEREITDTDISWNPIYNGSRGWETLHMLSGISKFRSPFQHAEYKREYNRVIQN
ncbi:hypothetical protein [Pontibacter brevis]